jgi:tripartite-type tricarboxylate transporter receptor subunit TctC
MNCIVSIRNGSAAVRAIAFLAAVTALHAGSAVAQDAFPSKPIRLVSCCVGFPENTVRAMQPEMQEFIKQPVIIESRPGANGILATEHVARAAPDGYTVLIGTNSTHAANQSLYKKLPYDFIKDFAPVSGIAQGALLFVVSAEAVPARTVAELTALAKKQPGKWNFGYGSSSARNGMELYKLIAGLDLQGVPFKTNPQVTAELLAGRIHMAQNAIGELKGHVDSGKLRALAVTGTSRSPAIPDVPTFVEAGVPGYSLTFWNAAWLPAGTPAPVVARVNAMFVHALNSPKVKEYLGKVGVVPYPTTPDELMKFQIAEEATWRKIHVAAGVQPE